ncbi:DUF819 family protein [Anoxybacillus geothermalis]|nr:DUF819 family protein [Anoxybacillus geothermalis]
MFGPALIVIIISIILANTRVVPFGAEVYGVIATYAVPLSIALMLLSVDIKAMLKLSKKPLFAMLIAAISVAFPNRFGWWIRRPSQSGKTACHGRRITANAPE